MDFQDSVFIHPFTCIIAGVTQSGKTQFVMNLIKNKTSLINPIPQNIVYSYSESQPAYSNVVANDVKFIHGMDFALDECQRTLLIIDDQMTDTMKDKNVQELFIRGVHHRNVSVILLNQNLFPQGKFGRDIRLNCHYYVIMKSPTLNSQVTFLGGQIFPSNPKFLVDSYKKATQNPYSYLILILHPLCNDQLRVRANIFPDEIQTIFLPK
jgi:hypothetical protein